MFSIMHISHFPLFLTFPVQNILHPGLAKAVCVWWIKLSMRSREGFQTCMSKPTSKHCILHYNSQILLLRYPIICYKIFISDILHNIDYTNTVILNVSKILAGWQAALIHWAKQKCWHSRKLIFQYYY